MSAAAEKSRSRRRRVAVVTGSRAEFGLLAPVMRAIKAHADLELVVVAAGSHLLPPDETVEEVRAAFEVAAVVPMQEAGGARDRVSDAVALGRGVSGFAEAFARLAPDWVVVLGDRIEAFAAASAASVGGFALAHLHGGDRAEGVADEAMRHAITKLAHVHLAATGRSAERIVRMGEPEWRVHVVGSPALDGLEGVAALDDEQFSALGSPEAVFLMHPTGRSDEEERAAAAMALRAAREVRLVALHPNHDAGRAGVLRAVEEAAADRGRGASVRVVSHLERGTFLGLLRRVGLLIGNSSAGLIEAAALGCAAVDIGARQSGRERAENVVHAGESEEEIRAAAGRARGLRGPFGHPYGDGRAGERVAGVLASVDLREARLLRKQNVY